MSDDYLDEDKKSGRLILLLSACLAAFIAWAGYFEIDQTVHTSGQVILAPEPNWFKLPMAVS